MEIKEIRALTNMSQAKFAKAMNIPLITIAQWESGTRKPPKYVVDMLERVVKEDFGEVGTYIVVVRGADGNTCQDYIQAISSQQAVDFLYGESRDEFEILDVAKVVNDWK